MGTSAIIWSADPRKGGRALAQIGGDGHPDNFGRLARATSRKSWCEIVTRLLARTKSLRVVAPAQWWFPPHNGLFVHDYTYWWDDSASAPMMAHYQYGPLPLSPDNIENQNFSDRANPDLRAIPVPEKLITIDTSAAAETACHRRSWCWSDEREEILSPERLFETVPGASLSVERVVDPDAADSADPSKKYQVKIDGEILSEGDTLLRVMCNAFSDRRVLSQRIARPDPKPFGVPFLYSIEDLLHETHSGNFRVCRPKTGRWSVEIDHPVHGMIRTKSEFLPRALLRARRQLLSKDGFRLERTPPFE